MARPVKLRQVCDLPRKDRFGPIGSEIDKDKYINMTVDEYETIRLIDYENLTQEECAEQMDIARATVQRIYQEARMKIASALVNGKILDIQGGNYQLCSREREFCIHRKCNKRNKAHCNKVEKE